MRLGHHCRAPPLAVQPSPAPTIRHGGGARRVGAGARRWADLQASVTSTGPVCGQTNPGGRGEIVVGAPQSADKSFFDESTSSATLYGNVSASLVPGRSSDVAISRSCDLVKTIVKLESV